MMHLSKVPIDGAHVKDDCDISKCATLQMYMLILFVVTYSFDVRYTQSWWEYLFQFIFESTLREPFKNVLAVFVR